MILAALLLCLSAPPPVMVPPVNVQTGLIATRYGELTVARAVYYGPGVPGDMNADRSVDLDDLLIALQPDRDLGDLLLVQGNFGVSDACVWVIDGQRTEHRVVFGEWWRPRGMGNRWAWITVAYD